MAPHSPAITAPPASNPLRVVVVSHVLPVRLEKSEGLWIASWDEDLACPEVLVSRYMAVGVRRLRLPCLFIGSPHTFVPHSERSAVNDAIRTAGLHCVCVYHEPSVESNFYQGYCKATLWPIMHNVIDVYNQTTLGGVGFDESRLVGPHASMGLFSPRSWTSAEGQETCWPDYCEVQREIARQVVENYMEGDLIWIHHYHMMLLPSYLARKIRQANIGIFMHQPWPSSEIFSCLSHREDLLRGILCADHIGFHLYEWARNFLSCCRRLLTCTFEVRRGGGLAVTYNGREVLITCSHMGVEPSLLLQRLPSPPVVRRVRELHAELRGYEVFVSVDMLEGLKGVPLKLLAFEHFLHAYPERAAKVRLLLCGMIPNARPNDYIACQREVIGLVGRINQHFPNVVQFQERVELDLAERLALWSVADVLVVTGVREGLNLVPLEFMVAREHRPGAIVLSEFGSLARVLSGAVLCNPWSVRKVSAALHTALSLTAEERAQRWVQDVQWCRANSASAWAQRLLQDVHSAVQQATGLEQGNSSISSFSPLRDDVLLNAYRRAARRLILLDYLGTLVPKREPTPAADSAGASPAGQHPPLSAAVRGALEVLCADPRNSVVIFSTTSRDEVERAFGSIAGCSLCADNGLHVSWAAGGGASHSSSRATMRATSPDSARPAVHWELSRAAQQHAPIEGWQARRRPAPRVGKEMAAEVEVEAEAGGRKGRAWRGKRGREGGAGRGKGGGRRGKGGEWGSRGEDQKENRREEQREEQMEEQERALAIVENYAERTHGACSSASQNGVVFDYARCDQEFGAMQAKELHTHLSEVLGDFPVEISFQPGKVNVQPRGIDKGGILLQALETLFGTTGPDFVLVLGDDLTDEPAFAALHDWKTRRPPGVQSPNCFSCTVGKKPSAANYFLDGQESVVGMLEALKWGSLRTAKSFSFEAGLSTLKPADSDAAVPSAGANEEGEGGRRERPRSRSAADELEPHNMGLLRLQPSRAEAPPPRRNSKISSPAVSPYREAATGPLRPSTMPLPEPRSQRAAVAMASTMPAEGDDGYRRLATGGCPFRQGRESLPSRGESRLVEPERGGPGLGIMAACCALLVFRKSRFVRENYRSLFLLLGLALGTRQLVTNAQVQATVKRLLGLTAESETYAARRVERERGMQLGRAGSSGDLLLVQQLNGDCVGRGHR
ncbi:hypothetical protein AB1Y20_015992 [Prymnesium parvum]|uniref:Alpha,alpha-trehalose-phosphate synthase (UDP-forming) n=1 Tax=Prymnesium parvum TaxID=97485 RepID=A0AB34K2L9_PRYPA